MTKRRFIQPKNRARISGQSGDPKSYHYLLDHYNQGRYESAASGLDDYMRRFPEDPDAWNLKALLHRANLQYEAAAQCLEHALRLNPKNATYWNNLGAMYKDLGQTEKAIGAFEKTIAIDPQYADAYYNLGYAYQGQGQYDLARQWYNKCLAIRPDFEMALSNSASLYKEQGMIDAAIESYEELIRKNPLNGYHWSNLLLCMNYKEGVTAEELYERHIAYGQTFENAIAVFPQPTNQNLTANRRLRVGFVSADFRTHSVAFFLMPFLVEYDRKRFEVFCYSNVHQPDATTEKMRALADHWRNIRPMSDADAGQSIRNDAIDILVDLAGHSGYNRLTVFAAKPAPIQVTWLGYPNTTGLRRVDYRLSDKWTDPPGESEALNAERLFRLNGGFLCYQPPTDAPDVADLPAEKSRTITFGSFNNRIKITEMTIRIWSRILRRIPDARIVLKSSSRLDDTGKDSLLSALESEGIAADRITILGYLPLREHFEAYGFIDIALDTFPYNGTTTTCEALYMGVPVLALEGRTHAGKVSAGILARVGLTDWIAKTEDEYVALAVQKARDLDALAVLRRELRKRMNRSSLMDRYLFTAEMQDAFRWMWLRYCEEQAAGRIPKLVVVAAMAAADAHLLTRIVEALILGAKDGTEIVRVSVNHPEDWDRQVAPLLANVTGASRSILVTCERWVVQARHALEEPGVFGFYVYHRMLPDESPANAIGGTADSKPLAEAIDSHSQWMRCIPALVAFRRIDWQNRADHLVSLMANRMGLDVPDERIAILAADAVSKVACGNQKGMDEMAFDRFNKEIHAAEPTDSVTIPLKAFRLIREKTDRPVTGDSADRLIDGYEHGDAEDIAFGENWWISFPRGEVSSEMVHARCCKDEPEPEQVLLQRWMTPGCSGLDIGAGFGLHTMTAANAAGPKGAFWAFEPDRTRWAYVARSIAMSSMHHIRLIRAALGNGCQTPVFGMGDPVPVSCIRLDDAMARYDMPAIDWVRIGEDTDVEAVLDGGNEFFALNSPLLQIAFQREGELSLELAERVREMGYATYRIVPGLDCLAPCSLLAGIDASQRYLFCCKSDRAAKLASMGVLVRQEIDTEATGRSHPSLWLDYVRNFPYTLRLIHLWEGYLTNHLQDPGWRVHQEAMSCYALSCTRELPLEDRWQALGRAHRLLVDVIAKKATFSRLMTMARVASEMGYDSQASAALHYLVRSMESGENVSIDEPFLFPNKRLDTVDPGEGIGNVVMVAILEALERTQMRMGHLMETENAERIDLLRTLPFYDERFDERRRLVDRQ
ncbi:tetratricopeptide repeat protein [Desulfatirhabdium butyrativorans]|uniref:O-linked N-acetylglucosamine transferase family protein n=1 Tax=Desulfatirhabdium butyrativorans TaxID=340467 RepID=UPI000685705A|nr:tetratricopeptide repeat protein [Desulfatirhabdium butyrativorans]